MKRSYFLFFTVFCLLFSAFLWGCGDSGSGSPGSHGSEDTGVILDATIVPSYLDTDTPSVDAFQDICDAGPPRIYEAFTDHSATVTINARLLNPNTTFQPGILYVQKYTISYFRSTDSIGSPPIESDIRFATIVITPPTGAGVATVADTVEFLDLKRKDKYAEDMLSGMFTSGLAFLNNYTAVYTFEGKNQFDELFSFTVQKDFQIGDFDNCGG